MTRVDLEQGHEQACKHETVEAGAVRIQINTVPMGRSHPLPLFFPFSAEPASPAKFVAVAQPPSNSSHHQHQNYLKDPFETFPSQIPRRSIPPAVVFFLPPAGA